jgi:hypothetical protein
MPQLSTAPDAPVTTVLVISGNGMPPFATRQLRQTLELISGASKVTRTVNGKAINLSPPQMRKFKTEVSCTDMQAPAFNGIWPGTIVTVDFMLYQGAPLGQNWEREIVDSYVEGNFQFARPRLTMMVTDLSQDGSEYDGTTSWKIALEEV